jgi:hypothetical protein
MQNSNASLDALVVNCTVDILHDTNSELTKYKAQG